MSIKLTDTQFAILNEAARREDRCLTMPKGLKSGPAQKTAAKLLAEGLVREIRAKPGAPVWRRDEEVDKSYALKLTAAGVKVVSVRTIAVDGNAHQPAPSSTAEPTEPTAVTHLAAAEDANPAPATPSNPAAAETDSPSVQRHTMVSATAPREGTKMAAVVGLLERDRGATLAELIAATDWLPHTVRAALTGLRTRGYAVTLDRSNKERGSAYAIPRHRSEVSEPAAAGATETPPALVDVAKRPSRQTKPERGARAANSSVA